MFTKNKAFNFNIDEYQRLFSFYGYIPFIFSYCFAKNYLRFGAIAFSDQEEWLSFVSKKKLGASLKEGVIIYGHKKNYLNFYKGVYGTIDSIRSLTSMILSSDFNKKTIEKYLGLLDRFRDLYRKTEFFFTDDVFANQDKYPDFKDNFKTFEKLKLDGRKFLNELFYSEKPFFVDVLTAVAKKKNVNPNNLLSYTLDELMDLFNGNQVDQSTIQKREQAYLFYIARGKIKIACGEDAKELIHNIRESRNNTQVLKGVIASQGKVVAKAYVIKVSMKNLSSISKVIDEMNQGDVLIVESTEPSVIQACKKASAILTNQGGMMSHAAIVAREFKIPCIVGLGNATNLINTGDLIEVDANAGVVKIIKKVDEK
ncbi:MAG: atp-grasp fold subdomain 1 [Candidatus Taylorbacteria bacterium]|nr:atp-grasp fold subdomain 1 [Candidatus Taylorbacteria bacterium]